MDSSKNTETPETPKAGVVEHEVLRRYGDGALEMEPGLCCPTEYETEYLKILPAEIIEKDYGCGNPSKYIHPGETVVDLGSGAGKICYIIAQKVGAQGRVIGVDFNDKMLNLARKYREEIASTLGYANVEFVKGMIQDLALDFDKLQTWLEKHPITDIDHIHALDAESSRLRDQETMIPDNTADVVVSNCVLNLVRAEDKTQLFREIFRVLKPGGRAVISDIVCDEDPTAAILADPELWSGCISGAFREDTFLDMFQFAGFGGLEILERQEEPWHVIDGVEFRSLTLCAWKLPAGNELEQNQAVVYRGPWQKVIDEHGHTYVRGSRMAVGSQTYANLTNENGPYANDMIGIEPFEAVPAASAKPFDSRPNRFRHPRETKGEEYDLTVENEGGCC